MPKVDIQVFKNRNKVFHSPIAIEDNQKELILNDGQLGNDIAIQIRASSGYIQVATVNPPITGPKYDKPATIRVSQTVFEGRQSAEFNDSEFLSPRINVKINLQS